MTQEYIEAEIQRVEENTLHAYHRWRRAKKDLSIWHKILEAAEAKRDTAKIEQCEYAIRSDTVRVQETFNNFTKAQKWERITKEQFRTFQKYDQQQ